MSLVRAVLLGTAAAAVLVYVLAAALALAVAASGGTLRIAAGPLLFLSVEHGEGGAAVALGTGLLPLTVVGGLLNGFAGAIVRRRTGHDQERVP